METERPQADRRAGVSPKAIEHHGLRLGAPPEAYWEKCLQAASTSTNIRQLALQSLPANERPKARRKSVRRAE